jgi:hypothetical protein
LRGKNSSAVEDYKKVHLSSSFKRRSPVTAPSTIVGELALLSRIMDGSFNNMSGMGMGGGGGGSKKAVHVKVRYF